jgi:hypothetical protein
MITKDLLLIEQIYNNMRSLSEDEQLDMGLDDERKEIASEPSAESSDPVESDPDPFEDEALIAKIKGMIEEYNKTQDSSLYRPLMEELAKLYAPEAKQIVQKLENDPLKTTRNNYGGYMDELSRFTGFHKGAMAFAMRDAGAGQGLRDAIKVGM